MLFVQICSLGVDIFLLIFILLDGCVFVWSYIVCIYSHKHTPMQQIIGFKQSTINLNP